VQLGLRLLLYRPLLIQCYILKVVCVATAHVLLRAYFNVNFTFTRKRGGGESNIGWPVELSEPLLSNYVVAYM